MYIQNKKNKHLTLEDREEIEDCLRHGMTFKAIGKRISKDPSTISKEVKRHIKVHTNSFVNDNGVCPLLLKAPFVCNGCLKRSRSSCRFARRLYEAKAAQSEYVSMLRESREGIAFNKESFYENVRVLTAGVLKGQHIYHIIKANDLNISKSTVYRNINKGYYYSIKRIDLPRAVKFKPRHGKTQEHIPKAAKTGRTYDDFIEYSLSRHITGYVEMDTLVGRIGGKTILTLHFTAFNFMAGILLENRTSVEVSSKLEALKSLLLSSGISFGDLMPVILTDNGGEFANVRAIEENADGVKEARLFFCDPCMPSEKPRIEKNHTLFRDIVPKGSSFDPFTQNTVDLIFSHVNAVKRSIYNGKSAYDLFSYAYSKSIASAFGISYIKPEDVVQSPLLLRR